MTEEGIHSTTIIGTILAQEARSDTKLELVSSETEEKRKDDSICVSKELARSDVLGITLHGTSVVRCLKKKLLVLDINGLLVNVVSPPPKDHKADAVIARRAIFKRPFCLEFLKFCFENFEVALWTSRIKKNADRVLDCLMGDMKHRLLFCWDRSHCTLTSFKTLENQHKPIVFKELKKIWEKHDPNLPWEKGYYNESNTLLLDDSPYKALLNPPYTSIFPHTFSFQNLKDNSLAAGGDLREYLDGLAKAGNTAEYVVQNPYGQEAISETSASWSFYHEVIRSVSTCQLEKMRL